MADGDENFVNQTTPLKQQACTALEDLSKEELIARIRELEQQTSSKPLSTSTMTCHRSEKNKKSDRQKKQRLFDFAKYNTRKVAFKLAYLGWDYQGFAGQTELFLALTKSFLIQNRESSNYSRCGRTDKGVSALGQEIKAPQRSHNVFILNKLLPPEIRILAWTPVDSDFSARFSCLYRVYKYFFPVAGMDIKLMNEAAQKFVGQHDFRNFCKMDISGGVVNFERTLTDLEVTKLPNSSDAGFEMGVITIHGLAFLWHQVRCLVALLFVVGQRLENPDIIDHLLDIKDCPRRPQYTMASELPLILYECAFKDISWIHDKAAIEEIHVHFQKMWALQNTRTVMIRSVIEHLNHVPIATPNNCPITWQEMNADHNAIQAATLIPGHMSSKKYRQLKTRSLCVSFEDKLQTYQAKKRRIDNEKDSSELSLDS